MFPLRLPLGAPTRPVAGPVRHLIEGWIYAMSRKRKHRALGET